LIHKDAQAAGGSVPPASSFSFFEVPECGQAGYQTVAATAGGKLAFATLATTAKKAPCVLEDRTAEAPVFDLCVVLPSAAGFSGSIATSQPYISMLGVGLALDNAGEPWLAYTGGPSGQFRCGATDMMMASVSGGQLGTPRTIAADSASTGMPADQATSCVQSVCNSGDATGFWPSIALDPASGNLGVAFRDMHFGRDQSDNERSDVEFARGPAFSVYTVDVARGGGTYNRLAFTPAGKAAVVHYIAAPQPAIWLDREGAAGWESQKLFTGPIREGLGFGVNSQGLHALAYYDDTLKQLAYRESADGSTWTAAEDVDQNGVTGYYPTLAFDDQGKPAIAYYRCGDSGAGAGCDAAKDGLYLARRLDSSWDIRKVVGAPENLEGLYPALAFVDGKAVIAFQSTYYDPQAQTSKVSLRIAKEM
jgi:hypothetical protein